MVQLILHECSKIDHIISAPIRYHDSDDVHLFGDLKIFANMENSNILGQYSYPGPTYSRKYYGTEWYLYSHPNKLMPIMRCNLSIWIGEYCFKNLLRNRDRGMRPFINLTEARWEQYKNYRLTELETNGN